MLERENGVLACLIIPHDRARLVEARRLRMARGAVCLSENWDIKRQAAPRARRTLDKVDCAPATRTKAAGLSDLLAALKT
jgi:hypothetical protein